jgi:hypothetical protein
VYRERVSVLDPDRDGRSAGEDRGIPGATVVRRPSGSDTAASVAKTNVPSCLNARPWIGWFIGISKESIHSTDVLSGSGQKPSARYRARIGHTDCFELEPVLII